MDVLHHRAIADVNRAVDGGNVAGVFTAIDVNRVIDLGNVAGLRGGGALCHAQTQAEGGGCHHAQRQYPYPDATFHVLTPGSAFLPSVPLGYPEPLRRLNGARNTSEPY